MVEMGCSRYRAERCPWQAEQRTLAYRHVGLVWQRFGVVTYQVAINATGSPMGTLTIADLTFTVNQSNESCQFTLMPMSDNFPSAGALELSRSRRLRAASGRR
jgi:hypothetical protein